VSVLDRKIIHIDMDCFFAAVEMRDFPEYRERPLAVGGSETRRGVIATCNYQARSFGVRSAMPTARALKLCPDLLVVPGRMSVYRAVSEQIRAIFNRYTHVIEPLSLDEAYLDVTDSTLCRGSATLIAQSIRSDIYHELNLTASAGVAPLKFLAKVASDMNKPNGQYVISPHEVQETIDKLPLQKIPGVGKVGLGKLHAKGLFLCEDVRRTEYRQLLRDFGKLGLSLWQKSHGVDDRAIITDRERKSVGVETTLVDNITSFDQCWQVIENQLVPELQVRMSRLKQSRTIIKLGIKVKFSDFQLTTIERNQDNIALDTLRAMLGLILERQIGREIRLIGLSVSLKPLEFDKQLSFFSEDYRE
jgi:DNA polymerase-4